MCGSRMLLARIEPEKPGYELRTFECPTCEHSMSVVVKI
jgi:transcription elongation factor Elf1